ncbi:MAG: UvrB/UvrC motif-containing protein [Planctomycetia bacterium]
MGQDVSHILEGWDFDPHELNVRVVAGRDGTPKIQMRVDLGLMQMEMTGRPDGQRPFGFDSLLDYYEHQSGEVGAGYVLTKEAVDELFREGWQFYQRYLCLFHLERYEPVVRDTDRNLRLFAFVRLHARRKRDQWRFDQYRPYVVLMNTRARAVLALGRNERLQALEEIDWGRRQIEEFLHEYEGTVDPTECFEMDFLNRWYDEMQAAPSKADLTRREPTAAEDLNGLRNRLQQAIATEDYEQAAVLRDKIRMLEQGSQGVGGPPSA